MADTAESEDRPQGIPEGLATADITGDVGFLLEKLGALGVLDANRELREMGLNARSYSVLSLACEAEAPTQKDLAEMLTLDPSQIVSLVDRLESEGLVERTKDARDRRVRRVRATAEGAEAREAARQKVAQAQGETLAGLSPEEVSRLVDLLHRAIFGRSPGASR